MITARADADVLIEAAARRVMLEAAEEAVQEAAGGVPEPS